ncbi:SMI1/KNR4 family protein [Pseudobacillus badius]|uniref:SMI1/KNR4 family protein n=1 Tax=Bacillus badius TaxID=1455 RepID=UPI000597CAAA|nr:SMI1/KNR4 family protein [Bacillus badius]KIL74491.1 hypothetical protein SD78_1560 [Bacillus badius]KZR58855.1 SMI1 / KNR4 family protein [Bacillus badius]
MNKSIWQTDNEDQQEPLTDEAVAKAEEILQVKLPESYIDILREQNGGYLLYDAYPTSVPTSWADDHIHVDHLKGIGEGGILETGYLIEEWGLPKHIVLISGDGHTWIALDYRKTSENPPVILIEDDGETIIELAPDFLVFLEGLCQWEEE